MADPLSAIGVAASVAGLLALGGKMISLLLKITSLKDVPDLAKAVLIEMSDISAALHHAQNFVSGVTVVPAERREYILVEHLVMTLTGCVTTYSELEAIVDNLGIDSSAMRVYDRTRWALKENEMRDILQRLQNHKSSLNLMFTILQCTSTNEIQQSVVKLCNLVEQAVASNHNLSTRLSRLEGNSVLSAVESRGLSIYDERDDNSDGATIRPVNTTSNNATDVGKESTITTFAFDSELRRSRAYLRANFIASESHSESSLTSSARRMAAFSIFSTRSLAEISNLSVYSLPICFEDVSNSSWYTGTSTGPLHAQVREYEICVRLIFGKIRYYQITPTSTGFDLKMKIYHDEGVKPWYFFLVFAGKKVPDTTILRGDLGIGRGCNTVICILQYSAGGGMYGG